LTADAAITMTYNFDPDRWYERQRRLVDARRDRGELDDAAYQAELEALEQRYDEMLRRLDKPFDLLG
jgi:hypothetical protein